MIPFRGGDLCPGTFGTPKLRNAASRYLVLSWEANDACIINKGLLIEAIEATVHQSSDSRGWTLTLLYALFFSNTWRSWSITWRQGFSHLKMIQNHYLRWGSIPLLVVCHHIPGRATHPESRGLWDNAGWPSWTPSCLYSEPGLLFTTNVNVKYTMQEKYGICQAIPTLWVLQQLFRSQWLRC